MVKALLSCMAGMSGLPHTASATADFFWQLIQQLQACMHQSTFQQHTLQFCMHFAPADPFHTAASPFSCVEKKDPDAAFHREPMSHTRSLCGVALRTLTRPRHTTSERSFPNMNPNCIDRHTHSATEGGLCLLLSLPRRSGS